MATRAAVLPCPARPSAGTAQSASILTPRPHSLVGAIAIGTPSAPALEQNNVEQITASITLPAASGRLPVHGDLSTSGCVANDDRHPVLESNFANNIERRRSRCGSSRRRLPELRATALDVPAVMQPGDTIAPTFQITNLGTASTDTPGPVQVALVASVTPDFNLGSSIVALYTLPSGIPGPVRRTDRAIGLRPSRASLRVERARQQRDTREQRR